jgi:predicted transcriptional regulator
MFRRKSAGLASMFGTLEIRVLEALWTQGRESSVRAMLDAFPSIAYTTLMTTMERLYRKGVLERRRAGRAFLYRPIASRQEVETSLVTGALEPLLRGGRAQPILSYLVDEVGRHDKRLLDDLERLVRDKRRDQEEEP